MLRTLIAPLLLAACASTSPSAGLSAPAGQHTPCEPAAALAATGDERARSEAVLNMDPAGRDALALALLPCLGDPDPDLRDGTAYAALSQMIRSQVIGPDTVMAVMQDTLSMVEAPEDSAGFAQPFAILTLAEVARTDRITPWMGPEERDTLIAAADAYLAGLTDYRGFSDTEGWRHGVAHTADLLMQLSLNPQLTKPQAEAILSAIALKAGPTDHSYIFGESERLAAPVMYLARRDFFTEEEWTAWFESLWPGDDPLRKNAYASEAALARLHNLRGFAEAVYVSARASNEATYEPVARAAFALLNSLP